MMKRALLIVLIAVLGIGLCAYPFIANYISDKNGSYAADSYAEQILGLTEEELQAAWEEAVRYNENLSGNPVHDPFVEGSGMVMQDNYYDVLSVDEAMGYVSIPRIKTKLPLYHGTSSEVLFKGIGHLEGSSMPVGGGGTHSVLTGHTGLSTARLFTDLAELEEGDTFYLYILDEILAYQIDQVKVVEPDDTSDLRRVKDEDYCTLVTCTPYGVNSHRLLVRGVRIEYIPEMEEGAAQTGRGLTEEQKILLAASGLTLLVMILIILLVAKRNPKVNRATPAGSTQPARPGPARPRREQPPAPKPKRQAKHPKSAQRPRKVQPKAERERYWWENEE